LGYIAQHLPEEITLPLGCFENGFRQVLGGLCAHCLAAASMH
jgi:hypothetical protein